MFRIFAESMSRWKTEKIQEVAIYGILWLVVLALVPVVMFFQGHTTGLEFQLRDVLRIWLGILPFFVLFLLHDLLGVPLLVKKKKSIAYFGVFLALMAVFGAYVWMSRRVPGGPPPPSGGRGFPITPEVMKLVMGMLMLGVNLGVEYYLKSIRGERRLKELQAENLSRQLETLRYQINPHFFMNTLNNIHALVDIDPEKAKASIEEFSKLMRHVLYEGDQPTIPLAKEMEYLRHYVSLMKLRYADTVRVDLSLPENDDGAEIPPLILASFVENAFKHGISYDKPSFVHVSLSLEDGKIVFRCSNRRHDTGKADQDGVGLANVRSRLDLLYGNRYTLSIDRSGDVYDIILLLPALVNPGKEGA